MSAQVAYDWVIANAGGPDRPTWSQRVIDDVLARTFDWFNGEGHPAPNPAW